MHFTMKKQNQETEFPLGRKVQMENAKWLAVIALAAVAAGMMIYRVRKMRMRRKLEVISNAGYELAQDIHYPLKHNVPGKADNNRSAS
jgi:hypothetical protein